MVSRGGRLEDLPAGSSVGTSSPRRRGFLTFARPDLDLQHQRGNVPTRVRAVETGRADAVVLAAAGLRRLGMGERITEVLDPDIMLPAAAQGALAVQIREDDDATAELVAHLDDPKARAEVTAERACLRRLEAGCQAPVGALASVRDRAVSLRAAVVTPDGIVRAEASGPSGDADGVGIKVGEALLRLLGMPSLRDAPWAGPSPRTQRNPT